MRVLFTTSGAAGHLGPLIPFADVLRARGHEVLMATRASEAANVAAAGFDVWPFADADPAARGAVFGALGDDLGSAEANERVVADVFAGLDAPAALPGILAACRSFGPDAVVHETCEFAGGIAAELTGVPGVRVGITLGASESAVLGPARRALAPLRTASGLAPATPDTPYFTLAPPSLDHPGIPGAQRFRENGHRPPAALPDWWDGDATPLVYLTLGTVAPHFGFFPGVYRSAVDALAALPVRVLVTTGRAADPAGLGSLPANVHAERWVPQADVMPHAAAMVCHGGSGTVRAGLAAGVPLAVLPLFADQPANAQRVHELGAGIAVADPSGLTGAVRLLLEQPSFAARARALADETRALPPVEVAEPILVSLARG